MTFGMIDAGPDSLYEDLEGLDENDPLRIVWALVHDSKEVAKKSSSWKLNDLLPMEGYVPGLPLMKKAGKADYHDLSAEETKHAFDLVVSFKPDNSGNLKIPRISRENFDISDSEHVFALLPKYILTNAGVVFRAMYEDSMKKVREYEEKKRNIIGVSSERLIDWDERGVNDFFESIKIGVDIGDNPSDVPSAQKKEVNWEDRACAFLDKYLPADLQLNDRIDYHFMGLKEVREVLSLPLNPARNETEFWALMQECMRLTNAVTNLQKRVEEKMANSGAKLRMIYAFIANIFEDCLNILAIYGDILRLDGIMQGYAEDRSSKLDLAQSDERHNLVNKIRRLHIDAQGLAIRKHFLEFENYRETKRKELSQEKNVLIEFDLVILDYDNRIHEISRKFFDGEVSTDQEGQELRWQMRLLELDRKILELDRKAYASQISKDNKRADIFARDAAILRIHRMIIGLSDDDEGRFSLQRKGEIMLLERECDVIAKMLEAEGAPVSDKKRHQLVYDYESKKLERDFLQLEIDLEEVEMGDSPDKKDELLRKQKICLHKLKIVEIDKKLNSPTLFLSEAERQALNSEKVGLLKDIEFLQCEIAILRFRELTDKASLAARSLSVLCERLSDMGSRYVKLARNGSRTYDIIENADREYKEKLASMLDLAEKHNAKIEEYKKLSKLIKRDKSEVKRFIDEGKEATEDCQIVKARMEFLEEKLESVKSDIAAKSEVINDLRNDINGLKSLLEQKKINLDEFYKHASEVMGSGGMDMNSYLSVLKTIGVFLDNLRQNYPEADELGMALNEKLVEEIAEGGRQVSLTSVRDQEKDSSDLAFRATVQSDPGYRPTMKSERDATYYPVDPSTPKPPNVEVIEPRSYRREIHDAVRDLMMKRQEQKEEQ